jgi:hypothetical protein
MENGIEFNVRDAARLDVDPADLIDMLDPAGPIFAFFELDCEGWDSCELPNISTRVRWRFTAVFVVATTVG